MYTKIYFNQTRPQVKSSDNNSMEFYKSIGYASQSIMEMTKVDVQNDIEELK